MKNHCANYFWHYQRKSPLEIIEVLKFEKFADVAATTNEADSETIKFLKLYNKYFYEKAGNLKFLLNYKKKLTTS